MTDLQAGGFTVDMAPAQARGYLALDWLGKQGGKFCKVSRWDDKGDSPGKRPIETGWQEKPLNPDAVSPWIREGGNVGLVCGAHSQGICLLDVDENYSDFIAYFPRLANAPAIVRDGADKGKVLIQIVDGDCPPPKKWKHPGAKSPYIEWLSDGNQGVIPPSGHPDGHPYQLVHADKSILKMTALELSDIVAVWTGEGLAVGGEPPAPVGMPMIWHSKDSDQPVNVIGSLPAAYGREYVSIAGSRVGIPADELKPALISVMEEIDRDISRESRGGLRESVLAYWTPLKIFEHFGMAGKTRLESRGQWLRLFGQGGLFVHCTSGQPDSGWNMPGEHGCGGGPFEAWMYAKNKTTSVPKGPGFHSLLLEMAEAGGIPIPMTRPTSAAGIPPAVPIAQRPRYIIRNAAYALQPQPPIPWLVEGLISAGSVNCFYGEPGCKKTYSMISLAIKVAKGEDWLDFKVDKPHKVLIIDEESGERRLSRRLGAAIRGELGDENLPLEYISLAQFKLDSVADVHLLETIIVDRKVELVIIDALTDIMDGNENDKKDIHPVFAALRKMAENTGRAVIIIHHANKVGGYRGSSDIKGQVDLMVLVTSENESTHVNFQSEKVRDGPTIKWAADAVWVDGGKQFYMTAIASKNTPQEPKLSKSHKYVMEYLVAHGDSSIEMIINSADVCSPDAARNAVYALAGDKKIRRTNPGAGTGRGVKAIYGLPIGEAVK